MPSLPELKSAFDHLVWFTEPERLPPWLRALVFATRLLLTLVRDLSNGEVTLRASSLVYTTLLSLVPLLAVSFSVLKGFGVHNQAEPLLHDLLEPLGEHGKQVTDALIGYVDNTNVGVLGTVGVAFLLYSVIVLIAKIEQAFNDTWHAPQPRASVQRFSQYLSLLLIGPVLFVAAVGATASLRGTPLVQQLVAIEPLGWLVDAGGRLVPYTLTTLAFAFAYLFVPNCRVRPGSALLGAAIAAVLWQVIGYLFANVMAGSTQYAAIYSSLAILILFMIWLQIAWLILLLGASIAFYHQFPEYLCARVRDLRLSNRLRERLGLMLAIDIAGRHQRGEAPWDLERLAHHTGMPVTNVAHVLHMLEQGGLVLRTADDPPAFVPARAPSAVPVTELIRVIRRYGEQDLRMPVPEAGATLGELEARLEQAATDALAGLTVAELAADHRARPEVD